MTSHVLFLQRSYTGTDEKAVHFENLDSFLAQHSKDLATEAKIDQFPWKQNSNPQKLSFRAKGFEKRLEKFAKGESSKLVSTPKRWTGSKYWPFGEDKQNLQDMTEVSKNNSNQLTASESRDEEYFEQFTRKKSFRSKEEKQQSSGVSSFFFRSKTLETSTDSTPANSFRGSPSAKNKAEAQWEAAQGGSAQPTSPSGKKKLAPQTGTRREEWDDELADYERPALQQTRPSALSPVMSGVGSESTDESGQVALITSERRDGPELLGEDGYADDVTISSLSVAPSVNETSEMRRVREMQMMREQRLREAEIQGTQASARINKPAFRDHLDVALSSKKMATAEL